MKKIVTGILSLVMLMSSLPVFAADNGIKVVIDGRDIEFGDVAPMIIENRTMVPLRKIFEELGAGVDYVAEQKMIVAVKEDTVVVLYVDRPDMYVGQKEVILDVPAVIVENRTLVPVRAVSEALDCDVKWDGETSSVIITSGGKQEALDFDAFTDTTAVDSEEKKEVHANFRQDFEQYTLPAMLTNADDALKNSFVNDTAAFVNAVNEGPWAESIKNTVVSMFLSDENNTIAENDDLTSLINKKVNEFGLQAENNYEWEACSIGGKNAVVLKMADIDTMLISTYIAIVYDEADGFTYYMLEKSMEDKYMLCKKEAEQNVNLGFVENNKDAFVAAVEAQFSAE